MRLGVKQVRVLWAGRRGLTNGTTRMMSRMFRTVLVGMIGTAAALGALWWMVNRAFQINGVGWLERQPFPWNNVWVFAGSGAIVGAYLGVSRYRRNAAHIEEAAEISAENDFAFEPKPEVHDMPPMTLFANLSSIENRMTTKKDGIRVEVFDLATEMKTEDGTRITRRTVVLLPAPGLPHFRLNAKSVAFRFLDWIGVKGVTFDPNAATSEEDRAAAEAFARNYQLMTADTTELAAGTPEVFAEGDEAARKAFPLRVLRVLAARPGWSIESHSGQLAFWQGTAVHAPRRRLAMIESALQLRTVFLQPSQPQEILPAIPGTDRGRQSGRMQGALLGGVIGAFASFFFGGLAVMILTFRQRPGPNDGFPLQFLLLPAIAIVGAALGVLIGTRLPIRGPLLKKPKDPKLEKRVGCAVLFGLFGGFFFGAILGAVAGIALDLEMDQHELRMALFFGGAGIGLFTGPAVCGILAKKILTRFSSKK